MTNTLKAVGRLTNFRKSHEYEGREGKTLQYYKADLAVQRLSDNYDYIPLVISSDVLGELDGENVSRVSVEGELRTRNYVGDDNRSHLAVYVKVTSIASVAEAEQPVNEVTFAGTICKPPSLRETATGRVISDLLIAHNERKSGSYRTKSYYVPALIWGSAAKAAHTTLKVGDSVVVKGRLQSRKYHCKSDPADVFHWAYEISVSDFQLANHAEDEGTQVA